MGCPWASTWLGSPSSLHGHNTQNQTSYTAGIAHGSRQKTRAVALPSSKGLGKKAKSQVSREQTSRQKVSQEQDVLLHFQLSWPLGRASTADNRPCSQGLRSRKSNRVYTLERLAKLSTKSRFKIVKNSLSLD